ncbi:hypothetical protein P692DRAFT_20858548 [Suillus brevipes Sb2]|nr:hypothetical protein P692DRAFT_20858548 [Suillus brevipes Sb2]
MDRAATQHAAISKTATKQTYTHRCGRCRTVLEYDTHADWPTISLLVNEHLFACLVKFDFDFCVPTPPPGQCHPSSEPDDTRDAMSPVHDSEGMGGRHDEPFITGLSKQRKSEAKRRRELQDDVYTYCVRPTSVRCRGCNKEISLDKRSRYYPGLWTKHRRKCTRIQKIQDEKLARSRLGDGFCPSNANANVERRPTAASLFEVVDNPRADGISRTGNSVEYNALLPIVDEEDLEEGDRDNVPFTALNQQFYDECWRRGERPWKYRYATTKEIMEQTLGDI